MNMESVQEFAATTKAKVQSEIKSAHDHIFKSASKAAKTEGAVVSRALRKIDFSPERMQYHRLVTEGDCPAALKSRVSGMKVPAGANTGKDLLQLVSSVATTIKIKRGEAERVLQQSLHRAYRDHGDEN